MIKYNGYITEMQEVHLKNIANQEKKKIAELVREGLDLLIKSRETKTTLSPSKKK